MSGATVPFRKMNGLGNDFVVLDARAEKLAITPEAVQRIADRKSGVGCDTVIVLEPSKAADVFMRIYSPDGSQAEACGNANRCIATIVAGETGTKRPTIETLAGVVTAEMNADGTVTVDMGVPKFEWHEIPLEEPFHDTKKIELQIGPIDAPVLHSPSVVNVGNPHCVFWVEDVNAYRLDRFGPILENHPRFPERANISLVHVASPTHLIQRVWERGVGLTQACGTGACAAAVCAVRKGFAERTVRVTLPGGDLTIEWREDDNHIYMTGPAQLDFESELTL